MPPDSENVAMEHLVPNNSHHSSNSHPQIPHTHSTPAAALPLPCIRRAPSFFLSVKLSRAAANASFDGRKWGHPKSRGNTLADFVTAKSG